MSPDLHDNDGHSATDCAEDIYIYNPILFYAFYAMLGKIDTDVCALGTAV